MNIKNIEEAKKYIGKSIYTNGEKHKYIGGVELFYNQVNYEIFGFALYIDKKCKDFWGDVKIKDIGTKFIEAEKYKKYYYFSKEEAEKYLEWLCKDRIEREKEYDIETAREIFKKHKVKFEIFE